MATLAHHGALPTLPWCKGLFRVSIDNRYVGMAALDIIRADCECCLAEELLSLAYCILLMASHFGRALTTDKDRS